MNEIMEVVATSIDQIQDWLVITDIDANIIYTNQQTAKISGYKQEELIGQKPSIWKSAECSEDVYKELWETILDGKPYYGVITNRKKNGEVFYLANTISPVIRDGKIKYFVSVAKDITQNYELKQQLHDAINYDSLTGLLNLASFTTETQKVITKSKNTAVLTLEIKKMDMINTTYGFEAGDHVIREICNRIKVNLPKNHVYGRIDTYIFAVLIPNFKRLSSVVSIIKSIERAVGKSVHINGEELYIELSAGVSIYPIDDIYATEIILKSQTALSQAEKKNGSIEYVFYRKEMNEEVISQLYLENELYKAYDDSEFIPFYQPLINLKDDTLWGFESLMRRKGSDGNIISPGEFIEVLEQMGIIDKVELRYLRFVCLEIKRWIDKGYKVVPVAINLSPIQFSNENLVSEIVKIIEDVGICKKLITIEITESIFMEDMELAKSILKDFKNQGFILSIDDFGTGYSTFSYLKEFNADFLKIDREFIINIATDKSDKAIVEAIIAVAKILDMKTIAEGVENKEQVEVLKELGCDVGQGFYWDAPQPSNQVERKYYYGKHDPSKVKRNCQGKRIKRFL